MVERFLVANGHALWRSGLVALLREHYGPTLEIREAETFERARRALRDKEPLDLAVVEADLPDAPRERGVAALRREAGTVPFVVLPSSDEAQRRAWAKEPRIFLVEEASLSALIQAIDQALEGRRTMKKHLEMALSRREAALAKAAPQNPLSELTEKQRSVLDGLIEGLSNKEIARREGVSEHAIKIRARYVMQKLQVANRTQAAMLGSRLRSDLP